MVSWLDKIKFNADGLVPVIAQDKQTGRVLMMAWANAEALSLTVQTKTAVYFSRSRGKLWHKGETSGHTQKVHDIFLDCDADVIILTVTQVGGIACHTGRESCFFQKLDLSTDTPSWQAFDPVLKNPDEIYGQTSTQAIQKTKDTIQPTQQTKDEAISGADILMTLDKILAQRKSASADSSYVASLYHKGINKILEKVGEEAVETIISAKELAQFDVAQSPIDVEGSDKRQSLEDDLIYEVADVWFHTLVTLAWFNIGSDKILAELARRFGVSGLDEKASRNQ